MMAGAPHPNVVAALATIARSEGPGALFNGVLLSAVVKQAPQMAITFATYEVGMHWKQPSVGLRARGMCSDTHAPTGAPAGHKLAWTAQPSDSL